MYPQNPYPQDPQQSPVQNMYPQQQYIQPQVQQPQNAPVHPEMMLQKLANKIKMLKLFSVILIFLTLLSGVASTVLILTNTNLINKNKASNDLTEVPLSPNVLLASKSSLEQTYTSTKFGFQFNYNINAWTKPVETTDSVKLVPSSFSPITGNAALDSNTTAMYVKKNNTANLDLNTYYTNTKNFVSATEKVDAEDTLTVDTNSYKYFLTEYNVLRTTNVVYVVYYFVQSGTDLYVVKYLSPDSITVDNPSVITILTTLKAAVAAKVQGASTTSLNGDQEKVVAENRSGVYRVFTSQCGSIGFNSNAKYPNLTAKYGGKSLSSCFGGMGSGFIIDNKCHLATNGHVVTNLPPKYSFFEQAVTSDTFLAVLLADFKNYLVAGGLTSDQAISKITSATKEELANAMAVMYLDMVNNNAITFNFDDTEYHIQKQDVAVEPQVMYTPSENKAEQAKTITATLLTKDFEAEELISGKITSSDLAILTLSTDCNKLITTKLGSVDNITSGTTITVIGFPGSGTDDMTDSGLVSVNSSTQHTVTSGVVSAIKKDVNGKILIQTDSSVNHGNSGGPCFDSNGDVVGIATYGNPSDKAINFCRDVKDLKTLMSTKSVVNSVTNVTNVWRDGLDAFYTKKYYTAASKMTDAKAIDPTILEIDNFIKKANDNKSNSVNDPMDPAVIQAQNDKDRNAMIGYVSAGVAGFLLLCWLINFIALSSAKSKYKKLSQMMGMPQPMM